MLQKHLQFSLGFGFVFIFELFLEIDPKTAKLILTDFHYVVKPLITISLAAYLMYHTQLKGRFSKRIWVGLLFGLVGDVLLMFTHLNDYFFIGGLLAFLLGHLFYISAFYIDYTWARNIEKNAGYVAIAIFGIFSAVFYFYLHPYLAELNVPVIIYMIVISIMAIMSVKRKGRVNTFSYNAIFYGAVLFVISDAILAFNKFIEPSKYNGVAIMAFYMIAQYLITIGAIERKMRKHSMITKKG
ncbi:MAG: lysoplasmalogenase [Pedobacter sp.]|nr:lysoplasmalogenase [Pedobacter sp.]MDQ8051851.1 lysoplasmalogenase [Pedobacter sp.]